MSPAKSEAQKTVACMAIAMKKGEMMMSSSKAAAEMANSMTEEQLREY